MFIKNGKRFNIHTPVEVDGFVFASGDILKYPAYMVKAGITEIPDPQPPEGYDEELYYRTEQDDAPYIVYTRKSDEQIEQIKLQRAKAERSYAVSSIVVTTQSGNAFDGHEDAQNRMARAIGILNDTDQMPWVLADNSVVSVTKAELTEALRLAGLEQARLWVVPYEG